MIIHATICVANLPVLKPIKLTKIVPPSAPNLPPNSLSTIAICAPIVALNLLSIKPLSCVVNALIIGANVYPKNPLFNPKYLIKMQQHHLQIHL